MNKILTLMLAFCAMMAACAPSAPTMSSIPNCPSGPPANACPPGNQDRDKIKIHVTPAKVNVTPPIVCAARGATIKATITAAANVPTPFQVATVPKDAAHGWVLNLGTGPGTMDIKVPDAAVVGTHYGYFVMTSTGKCVDPRIHVDK